MLEGVDKGKTATIQAGFDKGYAIAMKYIHQVDFAKGYIT